MNYDNLAKYGRHGDTMLAHITPEEAKLLKDLGGSGTINPYTGLPEYWGGLGSLNPFKSGSIYEKAAQGIGGGLASLDKAINKNIPGGWITVGGLAAGGLALAYAPEIVAFAESAGITPAVASVELGVPAVDTATGALINPATGLSWETTGSGLAGGGVQLTPAEFASQSGIKELTAKEVLTNASRAKQLANVLTGGMSGKPSAQQFAQFQAANQPAQEQFGGLYRSNQNPFLIDQTPQTAPLAKTQDFLEELSEQGKPIDLASLLRNV